MQRGLEFSTGEYYHVYSRGVEKRKIFLDERDHQRFVSLLCVANSVTPVHLSKHQGRSLMEIPLGDSVTEIGAWCLMPNHFHLLLKEKTDSAISLFMKKLLTGYSMYFNAKYRRKGTLFEGNFEARHLNTDRYLKYQYAYIHLNPVGIIDTGWKEKNIKDKVEAKKFLVSYKYSSYQDYAGVKRDEGVIINKKSFPDYFEKSVDFDSMMDEWLGFND